MPKPAKPYSPKGKFLLLLQLMESDPYREFSGGDAAEIMGCDRRAVASQLECPRRHGFVFIRKEGNTLFMRGKAYAAHEAETYCTARTMRAAGVKRGWTPSPDDVRIPKVVPGWTPPVMVPPRGAGAC